MSSELPLSNLRVLDVSGEMGGYGTRLFALAGADVVKVEPIGGDRQRRRPPIANGGDDIETSLEFAYYNAGKRGVAVDFADAEFQATMRRLGQGVDIVMIAPSVRAPIPGWDPVSKTLAWADPASIVCCLTSFGTGGPDDGLRATQMTSYAASGQMLAVGPEAGPPRAMPGHALYDELATHAAAFALAALRERDAVGGQVIELSLHDMLAYRDSMQFAAYAKGGHEFTRTVTAPVAPTGAWETKDGRVELLVYNPPHWDGFFELVGRPAELSDPALRDRAVRTQRGAELAPLIASFIASMTTEEFVNKAQKLRVPCGPSQLPLDVVHDPQLASRKFWAEYRHPRIGTFRAPGVPFLSRPALIRLPDRPAPLYGEHTDELLADPAVGNSPKAPHPDHGAVRRLTDLKVVSFGTAIAGNVSATTLAELGADVIKIEAPGRPDPLRAGPISARLPRVFEPSGVETNVMFSSYSRSCRSVALDMKAPDDRETFMKLIADADVLIDNFASGVMAGWGITHESLATHNPRLVMLSVSGYGRTGPRAEYMAYGSTINSFMGLTRVWAPHGTQFDYTAVAHGLFAVFTALAARDRTGMGAIIDIAQVEAGAAMLAPLYLSALNSDDPAVPEPNTVPGSALAAVLRCAGNDQWVAVELEDGADVKAAAALVGVGPDDLRGLRVALEAWAGGYTAEQAMRELQTAGLAGAAVRGIRDEFRDPQLWARGGVVPVDHPVLGAMLYPRPFQRLSRTPVHIRRPSAQLGEHTEQVLAEWLGSTVLTET
jgi:crotonobetainyl-CoA:carnitine CoA-transferase CaiB-like acyl-CoA transferase